MQTGIYLRLNWFLLAAFMLCPLSGHARQLEVPVRLEQGFLQRLLAEQVYTETGVEARVWDDGKDCNRLTLSAPELDFDNGQVHTRTAVHARIGSAWGTTCFSVGDWNGYVEIFQEPVLGSTPGIVDFIVVDSTLYQDDSDSPGIPGTLWNLVKKYVHPRFNRLQLNLHPLLEELKAVLALVFPLEPEARRMTESVSFSHVDITGDRIELGLRFEGPESAAIITPAGPEPLLTGPELARWEESWQHWDAFITLVIKHAGADTELHDLRVALLAVLLDARQDLISILGTSAPETPDPIPELFVKTWEQLAPELRKVSATLPTSSVMNYLSFITAADALAAIQTGGQETGFALTADALRRMVRMLAPATPGDPLHYDIDVDPELRSLFGFGPPLPPLEAPPAPAAADPDQSALPSNPLRFVGLPAMLISFMPVLMARDNPYLVLVSRLNGWVPSVNVLNEYLPQMQLLLNLVSQATLVEKKLDAGYTEIYRSLVLTTAWQESCWRQHIKVNGEIKPIVSVAGALGIMQVNPHVWRGFYDVNGLQNNVGYNAEAGSEIVYHYLVDYAIAKGEHQRPGGNDNLARATYAMYNGGPRHISRYRREDVSDSLRVIDAAFWKKFQSIRSGHILAVAECYTGEG